MRQTEAGRERGGDWRHPSPEFSQQNKDSAGKAEPFTISSPNISGKETEKEGKKKQNGKVSSPERKQKKEETWCPPSAVKKKRRQ